ncbi:LysM peptidoglycan-binding domain-containing protein [Cellulomonas sp. 179-A 4D5 NHS]|uniref:CIS tube protein n=1 Tax=Cellulomonas sp. 179-A 4D5 NHS TaxID=3142378 RepID=UPI00399F4B10
MGAATVLSAAGGGGLTALEQEPGNLQHAYLEICQPAADGSLTKPGPRLHKLMFQFNPKELTLAKSASWGRDTSRNSKKSGPPQYNGPQPAKLTLEMFFDASAEQDDKVVKNVELLFECCVPTQTTQQQKKGSPPFVLLRWGPLTGFLAYIASVQAKYTLFTAKGLPIRAVCTVTLEELAGEKPGQNPTSGGLVPRRLHVVVDGDSLAGVAYREYGDAALWRAVAQVNGIDDPMRLRPGQHLLLPSLDEIAGPRGAASPSRAPERHPHSKEPARAAR